MTDGDRSCRSSPSLVSDHGLVPCASDQWAARVTSEEAASVCQDELHGSQGAAAAAGPEDGDDDGWCGGENGARCHHLIDAPGCGGAKEEQEVKPANGETGDKGSVTTMASSDSSDTPCTLQDTRPVATSLTSPDDVKATVSSPDRVSSLSSTKMDVNDDDALPQQQAASGSADKRHEEDMDVRDATMSTASKALQSRSGQCPNCSRPPPDASGQATATNYESQIGQLTREIHRLSSLLQDVQTECMAKVARLEAELKSKTHDFHGIISSLKTAEDLVRLKKDIALLTNSAEVSACEDSANQSNSSKVVDTSADVNNGTSESKRLETPPTSVPISVEPLPLPLVASSKLPSLVHPDTFASFLGQEMASSYALPPASESLPSGAVALSSMLALAQLPVNGFAVSSAQSLLSSLPSLSLTLPLPAEQKLLSAGSLCTPPADAAFMAAAQQQGVLGGGSGGQQQGPGLDTAEVAQRIRDILSTFNIGQRLFAKHVLGLSQGTVSELLSKPKHWDKLTEKGRESYRKMHLWASDEHNIHVLKAISPRKGCGQPPASLTKNEDTATEERIAHILSEAQAAMQAKDRQDNPLTATAAVASIYQQELAKLSPTEAATCAVPVGVPSGSVAFREPPEPSPPLSLKDRPLSAQSPSRGRRPHTDSERLSQEMVERIYCEELQKLASSAEKRGNMSEYVMYQQELSRLELKRQSDSRDLSISGAVSSSSAASYHSRRDSHDSQIVGGGSIFSSPRPVKIEPFDFSTTNSNCSSVSPGLQASDMPQDLSVRSRDNSTASHRDTAMSNLAHDSIADGFGEMLKHAGSAFSLVRPRSDKDKDAGLGKDLSSAAYLSALALDGSSAAVSAMSPLERMQCIANSFILKNGGGLGGLSGAGRFPRVVLPPISQEQLDAYVNINTDELVTKVKDRLSLYSISQRVFGEQVLGLSQGSVSDLLARPKPWHMLTQKGREPFIRMQMFLESPDACVKLVTSQYQMSAAANGTENSQRLSSPLQCNLLSDQGVCSDVGVSALPATTTYRDSSTSSSLSMSMQNSLMALATMSYYDTQMPSASSGRQHQKPAAEGYMHANSSRTKASTDVSKSKSPTRPGVQSNSPIELATKERARKPKSTLIGGVKRKRCEVTTNVVSDNSSTQHVNELDTASIVARVRDVLQGSKMSLMMFANTVLDMSLDSASDLLAHPKPWVQLDSQSRDAYAKMNAWLGVPQVVKDILKFAPHWENPDLRRPSSEEDIQMPEAVPGVTQTNKRRRIFFTDEQRDRLLLAYATEPYPSQTRIEALSAELGVGVKTVVNWFHNHRMRSKQPSLPQSASPSSSHEGTSATVAADWPADDGSSSPPSNVSSSSDVNALHSFGGGDSRSWGSVFPISMDTAAVAPPGANFMAALEQCVKRRSGDELAESAWKMGGGGGRSRHRQSVVNKRKRSRPQWVCEGRQLDRSQPGNGALSDDDTESNMEENSAAALAIKVKLEDARVNSSPSNGWEAGGGDSIASTKNGRYSHGDKDYRSDKRSSSADDNENCGVNKSTTMHNGNEGDDTVEEALDMRQTTVKNEPATSSGVELSSTRNSSDSWSSRSHCLVPLSDRMPLTG